MKASNKRIIRMFLISIPAILAGIVCVCLVAINTQWFRDFLRSKIIERVGKQTGGRVEIGAVAPHWSQLSLDLNDLVVHGSPYSSPAEPALLNAKRLDVAVQLLPLLHGKLELRTIILDQPVVRIRIDSQGRSNLPVSSRPSTNKEPDTIFDLAIQNCTIRSGQIYYNDAQIPLDAEVHDLKLESDYGRLTREYKGSLSYREGRLATKRFQSIDHAMQLEFTASRSGLALNSLTITSGASRLVLNAKLTNYADAVVEGRYMSNLFSGNLADTLKTSSLPVGEVVLNGQFSYHARKQQSILAAATVEGQMRSDKLVFRTRQGPFAATALSASYTLKNANLQVQDMSARVLGGQATADCAMSRLDSSTPSSRVNASLHGVSLATISDTFGPQDFGKVRFVGTTNGEVQASWSISANHLWDHVVGHARLTVSSPTHGSSAPGSIALTGLVQAEYDGPRNQLSFGQSYLQTASTRITIAGTLDSRRGANSNINAIVTTGDLHEVTSLISLVEDAAQPPRLHAAEVPYVQGRGSLNARITGSARDPQIQGQLSLADIAFNGTRWRALGLNLNANSSQVEIQNGKLAADARAQVTFAGRAGLQNWSLAANSPVLFQLTVANMSIPDVEKVAQLNYPVSGTVSGKVSVSGTKQNPEGTGTLTVARGSAWNEAFDNATVRAESRQGNIHSNVDLGLAAGSIVAEADYKPATQEYSGTLHTDGLKLDQISAIQRGIPIRGVLKLFASGHGTIQNPELEASLATQNLQVRDQSVSNLNAHVTVENQHANVAAQAEIDQGQVAAKGVVELTGRRYSTASVDVTALPLTPVLANFFPTQSSNWKGQTEIHLTAQGPLRDPMQMQAHLEIPTLEVSYGGAQIALAHSLTADYHEGTVTVAPTEIQGPGTNLTFQGDMPLLGGAPHAASVNGTVDLAALQKFAPGIRSSGRIDIHLKSQGTFVQPGIQGQLRVTDATFSSDTVPVGIEALNAQINLSGNRADIGEFAATAGGGSLTAQGFVTYGRETAFNLGLGAKSVRVRYPEGLRSILSGQLYLAGGPHHSNLTGRVLVDHLSFTQAFDLSNFAGQFSQNSSAAAPSEFASDMKLNVAVQSADSLNLASSKVSVAGTANLNVTGTLAIPVVLGRIALTSGDVFFLGKRFEIQNGTIEFANSVRTEPVVTLYVKTTIDQYNIALNLSGPVDRLTTHYTSEPALPPADIIHLLAFGTTTAEAASTPTSPATSSAESVLAEGVSSQVAGNIENFTGISQVSIDPLATNSQGSNPGSQVAIQERVTGSVLLTISTDVNSTQNQLIELQYQLSPRTSVTVLRDQYGGYGIYIRLHKLF